MSELQKAFLKKKIDSTEHTQIEEDDAIISNYKQFKLTFQSIVYEKDGHFFKCYFKPPKNGHVLFCHHGAGSSSMTFGEVSKNLDGVFLFDMRGHGDSSDQGDFSLNVLVEDVHFILNKFMEDFQPRSIFFMGHSLGGAVFAKYTSVYQNDIVKGLILLDIVEETAVKALSAMPQFIANRPKSFLSISKAIEWHMSFLLSNLASAKLSVPDLFHLRNLKWKTNLNSSANYWCTWFTGLSDNFISFRGSKLLILSSHETLDKKLMIGQMQGKYQLVVFNSGHFVHEDLPMQVSVCLNDFINKTMNQRFETPKWGGNINH